MVKFNIDINGKSLQKVDCVKFLGVFIDSKLTWHEHIKYISTLVAKSVGILSKLKHILPRSILRSLYQTLVLPHLTYCCIIWSGSSKYLLNKLIILQKRAIRHITFSHSREHTNALFKSMNLLKLIDLFNLHVTSFVYLSLHDMLPNSLNTQGKLIIYTKGNVTTTCTRMSSLPCHFTLESLTYNSKGQAFLSCF